MRPTVVPASLAALAVAFVTAKAEVPGPIETMRTSAGNILVTEVASGLVFPWGLAFLPDGRMLVTEKPGRLRLVSADGKLGPDPVAGTPEVFAEGQGGLLDVVVDPGFSENGRVWLTFAEPGEGGTAGTALGRGRLADGRLEDWRIVWRQQPKVEGPNHFGGRIVFADDGTIFVTLGERFKFEPAQDLSSELGKIVHLTAEGEPAAGNPFVDEPDADAHIFTYGHRNIEAAGIDPETGALWIAEMGPLGGDELNRIEAGANYGWPLVSWGTHYDGEDIPDPPTRPEFHGSTMIFTPVISPSGMIFYGGELFPEFVGDAFVGSLTQHGLVRLEIGEDGVAGQEMLPLGRRIREVATGPDGAIYVLTDRADGEIWKLQPQPRPDRSGETASGG